MSYSKFPVGCVATSNGVTGVRESQLQNLNGGSIRNAKSTELFTQSLNGGNFSTPALNPESSEVVPVNVFYLGFDAIISFFGLLTFDNSAGHLSAGDLVLSDFPSYPSFHRITVTDDDFAYTDYEFEGETFGNCWRVDSEMVANDEFLIRGTSQIVQRLPSAKSHSVKSIRTIKTKTAIREGNWDEVNGEFTVLPSESNDFGAMGVDDVTQDNGRGLRGEFSFATQSNPATGLYSAPD